jgi:hypothetical protein
MKNELRLGTMVVQAVVATSLENQVPGPGPSVPPAALALVSALAARVSGLGAIGSPEGLEPVPGSNALQQQLSSLSLSIAAQFEALNQRLDALDKRVAALEATRRP